jgi:hypothetical protein
MNPIAEIKERLAKYPDLRYRATADEIVVLAPSENGFDVALASENTEYVVSWGGWHDHFDDPAEALEWFARGLADEFRLRLEYRGRRAWRFVVEQKNETTWQPIRESGALFFPFWLKRRIEYRQNNIMREYGA